MPVFSCLIRSIELYMGKLLNGFTMKTKYGAMAVTATPIVVFASVYLALAYVRHAWKGKPANVFKRSISMGTVHGGKQALERLIDYHSYLADPKERKDSEKELQTLLNLDYPDLQSLPHVLAKLEMCGKEAEAVKMLRKAVDDARKQNKPHEAYEIEMLLVEMLIYKGDVKEALACKCLNETMITDARRPLYKAIIHVLKDEKDLQRRAKELFDDFIEIRRSFQWPPISEDSEIYKVISSFEEFKRVVHILKQEIEDAKKKKK